MRPKEHPELIFDVIPKLYERKFIVIITNLGQVVDQLQRLPKKFCKMYTTRCLADQLMRYLQSRDPSCISEQDFCIVGNLEPFTLRFSDGRRLDAMLCAGNELNNSLMALIRRPQGGPLLYYYSAVQQDDMCRLMGNAIFHEWISNGTEVLYVNLEAAERTFTHLDWDSVAVEVARSGREQGRLTLLELPLFGYEHVVRQLGLRLYSQIRLLGAFKQSYRCLPTDMDRFDQPDEAVRVLVCAQGDWQVLRLLADTLRFPVEQLRWSPVPTAMHLRQLCSLLRPQNISGIVEFHANSNVPRAPLSLQRFRATFSPRNNNNDQLSRETTSPGAETTATAETSGLPSGNDQSNVVPTALYLTRKRQLIYVDDDNDDND